MKRLATIVVLSLMMTVFTSPMPNRADAAKNTLILSVTLDDIFNHHFQVMMPIAINQSFKVVAANGSVTNTISGTVGPAVQGKYPLPLYVSEEANNGGSMSGTTGYNLELGKEVSGGPVSSFVFLRTVKLTQIAQ